MKEIIAIQNLKCGGCASSIIGALQAFPEVASVSVDLTTNTVIINTNGTPQRALYEDTLTAAGYPPEGKENPLGRKAKSFVSCAIGRMKG